MFQTIRRIPLTYWGKSAAVGAGSGLAIALVAGVASWAIGQGFWYPINLVAAAAGRLPPSHAFAWGASGAGLALHLLSTALWGLAYGLAAMLLTRQDRWDWGHAILAGIGFGAVCWLLPGLMLAPGANTIQQVVNPWAYFIGYLAYGMLVATGLFAWTRTRELVKVTFAPEAAGEVPSRESVFR